MIKITKSLNNDHYKDHTNYAKILRKHGGQFFSPIPLSDDRLCKAPETIMDKKDTIPQFCLLYINFSEGPKAN